MLITKTSQLTGIEHTREIDVTVEQFDNWNCHGMLIQDAMPHLSPADREFILSGITPEEWEAAFAPDDEDE